MINMNWVLLAFSSVFFFTAMNLLQRKLAVNANNPRAMAILFNGIAASMALLIFFISGSSKNFSLPTQIGAWIAVLIASFCYGMYERSRFIAAKLLDASVFTTISTLSVLVAFVGSAFLYSESLSINKLAGGLLIILSLFLVSLGKKHGNLSLKGILIAVLINIMLGLGWMLDKKGALFFNASTYNIFVWILPLIFIYFPRVKFGLIKKELKIASWKVFLLAGLNAIGYLLQLKALEVAEATRIIPIVQTSTLFTVIMGIILLKEKNNILRKITAGMIAVVGVYLLV